MIKGIFRICRITINNSPITFTMNLLFIVIMAMGIILMSYSHKLLIDAIIDSKEIGEFSINTIVPVLLYFLAITVSGNFFNFQNMLVSIYTKKSRAFFASLFLYKSYNTPQDNFYDSKFYDNYEFTKENINSTSDVTVEIFNKLLLAIFNLIFAITAIAIFDIYILICILILSIAFIVLNNYIVKKKVALNEEYTVYERRAKYFSKLLGERTHAKELRIQNSKFFFLSKWEENYKKYTREKFKFEIKATLLNRILGAIKVVMENSLIIYFLYLVLIGDMGAGDSVFLISLMKALNYRVGEIVEIVSKSINEKCKYIEKYEEFVGRASKNILIEESCNKSNYIKEDFRGLELRNVSYRYAHGKESAIENLNLRINKGEIISILGYNGSGKSTLSKIISGVLENYSGQVLFNNRDIRLINKEKYYESFGIAFQEFSRYSISLKENVSLGMVEEMDNEKYLKNAMEKGNLKDIIEKLPNREETILGKEYDEEGEDLSGGQWQRVALSRAYMGEPDFLILDEPTAAIDPIEEMRMLNQFKEIVKGKTALLISHRVGFARMSSRIVVMESGAIVEDGTHEELMKLKGAYYKLFTAQKELYEEAS